jgi:hypothetical protein
MANPVMVERKEPRFVQFAIGEVVNGILVSIDRITVKDKAAVRYTVREDDGEYCAFIGTHQLNTKLRLTDKGFYVSIRCEGEDASVRRGENCMKVFKVLVSAEKATDASLYITDEDIPF